MRRELAVSPPNALRSAPGDPLLPGPRRLCASHCITHQLRAGPGRSCYSGFVGRLLATNLKLEPWMGPRVLRECSGSNLKL
jgi:hypothetical protein